MLSKYPIQQYSIHPKKHLGQHFLKNKLFLHKINNTLKQYLLTHHFTDSSLPNSSFSSISSSLQLVEIGPGRGDLTKLLQTHNLNLVCIEKDVQLAHFLHDFNIHYHCALTFDYKQLFHRKILIANLPYNISVTLILKFIEEKTFLMQIVLVQKEVADRITASYNCKDYGKVSVLIATFTKPRKCFNIPASAFNPPPKVISTLITLEQLNSDIDFHDFNSMLTIFFAHRRKMLRSFLPLSLLKHLYLLNIKDTIRSCELTPEQYQAIYKLSKQT